MDSRLEFGLEGLILFEGVVTQNNGHFHLSSALIRKRASIICTFMLCSHTRNFLP
jgi:hypothetical protein